MGYPRCRQCQKLLYTREEISQKLCSACAQKSLLSPIHAFCPFHPEAEATGICSHCHSFICDECRVDCTDPATKKITTYCRNCAKNLPNSYYYCAWEDKSLFFYRRFWITWEKIIFHPADFFNQLPRIPDTTSPLTFDYLSYAHFFLFMALMVSFGNLLPSLPALMMGTLGLIVITSSWLILVPATLYFSALIIHLGIVVQLKKKKFHQTLRIIGYANAIQVLQMLPIINLIAGIWYLVIIVKGLKRVHQLSTGQAILAITLIPLLFIILAAIILTAAYNSLLLYTWQAHKLWF